MIFIILTFLTGFSDRQHLNSTKALSTQTEKRTNPSTLQRDDNRKRLKTGRKDGAGAGIDNNNSLPPIPSQIYTRPSGLRELKDSRL